MISVQNHLQRLSGNKKFLILIIVFALFSSCAAGKKTKSSAAVDVVDINQPKNDTVQKNEQIFDIFEEQTPIKPSENIEKVEEYQIPETKKEEIVIKDKYRIAVILPFILNQIPISGVYANDTTKQLLPNSKAAMDFYLGCKLANQSITNFPKKLNVYFIDDNNNSNDIQDILSGSVVQNADYIIAPFEYDEVKVIEDFGKANKKNVISPTLNSMYLAKNNTNYYLATPSNHAQYYYILNTIAEENPTAKVEVIYNSLDSISENISLFKNLIQYNTDLKDKLSIVYKDLANNDIVSSLYQTDTLSPRTLLFYSSNPDYIKTSLNKLNGIKNNLSVYINSSIYKTKSLIGAKNFHHQIYTVYPYSASSEKAKAFKDNYTELFVKEPTELSYLGYDLMKLLFYKIDKDEALTTNTEFWATDFLQQNFKFIPKFNHQGEIDYYDNAAMNLYKYSNGSFFKIK